MKRRCLGIILLMSMVLSVLASCGIPGTAKTSERGQTSTTATVPVSDQQTQVDLGGEQEEQITLKVMDCSDSIIDARARFHERYMAEHPNIKIEYTMLTIDQYKNTVVTMVKSGDGPDVLILPFGMRLPTALSENWLLPMDAYLTDEFLATLDATSFVEGVTTMDQKIYMLCERESLVNTLIFYNKDVLDAAGVTSLPESYDEFIAVCKQVTEAGNGAYYGLIEGGKQTGRLEALIRAFTGMAGGKIAQDGRALTVNGRAPYDSPELIGTFRLFETLTKEGCIHPDTVNISAPEARELFAQGQAAFIMQGIWCIGTWNSTYPDMNYGVMAVPTPDGTRKGALQLLEPIGGWGIYSQSKYPQQAADYLMAMYDIDKGVFSECVASGERLCIVPAINEAYTNDEVLREYIRVTEETALVLPSATERDHNAFNFYTEVRTVEPTISALMQGILSESVSNYEDELASIAEATTAEWKRACEAIGLDFAVFEFPNWDVTKNYTAEDYAALK